MYQNTCDMTPLPDVDVNPLQDFMYINEFSPVSSPDSIHINEEEGERNFSAMLPAFSVLFERDFSYEEACRTASVKSEDFVVNLDKDSKSHTKLEVVRRELPQSCVTAPAEETPVSGEASPNLEKSTPVWEMPVRETLLRDAARATKRGEKRQAPNEELMESTRKRKKDIGSSSPDTTTALPQRCPPGCSSPGRAKTDVVANTKRIRINLRERVRTKIVSDALSTLRETIPLPTESKTTKLQTLKAATHYIQFLHEVYAASACELIHGEVPKTTKCGVRYALSGFKRKSIREVFSGNSEVLGCAFNLWIRENELDEISVRSTSCCDEYNQSSPTTTYPSSAMSSSLSSPTMSSAQSSLSSPTVSPSSPIPTTSSAYQPDLHQRPVPWTWDY